MEPDSLGGNKEPPLPAGVYMVAADDTRPGWIRRPSSVFSYSPDPVYVVWKPDHGRQGGRDIVRKPGSIFMLLVDRPISN